MSVADGVSSADDAARANSVDRIHQFIDWPFHLCTTPSRFCVRTDHFHKSAPTTTARAPEAPEHIGDLAFPAPSVDCFRPAYPMRMGTAGALNFSACHSSTSPKSRGSGGWYSGAIVQEMFARGPTASRYRRVYRLAPASPAAPYPKAWTSAGTIQRRHRSGHPVWTNAPSW